MSGNIKCDIDDGIAWIEMDDGKVNAMSTEMMAEIGFSLRQSRVRSWRWDSLSENPILPSSRP